LGKAVLAAGVGVSELGVITLHKRDLGVNHMGWPSQNLFPVDIIHCPDLSRASARAPSRPVPGHVIVSGQTPICFLGQSGLSFESLDKIFLHNHNLCLSPT